MCIKIKNFYDDDKDFFLYDKLFETNRNFTTEHIKIRNNSWFFVRNSRFFVMFPGKLANLMIF